MTVKLFITDLDGVAANNKLREEVARNNALHITLQVESNLTGKEQKSVRDSIFYSGAGLFNPSLISLDEPIEYAQPTLKRLAAHGYLIVFQSSRPEYMRAATLAWIAEHFSMSESEIRLVLCPHAARENFTRTPVLKTIQLEAIVSAYNATEVVYVDDDTRNIDEIKKYDVARKYKLSIYEKLIDVLE